MNYCLHRGYFSITNTITNEYLSGDIFTEMSIITIIYTVFVSPPSEQRAGVMSKLSIFWINTKENTKLYSIPACIWITVTKTSAIYIYLLNKCLCRIYDICIWNGRSRWSIIIYYIIVIWWRLDGAHSDQVTAIEG